MNRFVLKSYSEQRFVRYREFKTISSIISNNTHISKVLSGKFINSKSNKTDHDEIFFRRLVDDLSDSVITMNIHGLIQFSNKATERILRISCEDILNTHISNLSKNIQNDSPFDLPPGQISTSNAFERDIILNAKDLNKKHLHAKLTIVSHIPVLTLRDITQTVMYQRLIEEEKSKSDKLLASILPANLLSRVQEGEKNISFSVQNVSVLFLDIVEFTPWCGSLPASTVMNTLNRIFVELDRDLTKYTS
jgi:transcriptional regulator with PAS, ATPase and Fis domain